MMTEARLREIYGAVHPAAASKIMDRLDAHGRDFIAKSPFMMLATAGDAGLDISPKGDPAGFVLVEDDQTLILPDRPGNNRLDGMLNLLRNPSVALLFMIPTVDETLRVTGRAEISEDGALRARCAVNGRQPATVLRIGVEKVFLHCGKAPLRAGLWRRETWPEARPVPTLYEMIRDQARIDVPATDQDRIEAGYRKTLY